MPYAYTNTVPGLTSTIHQLRSVFPVPLNADTLKKWSIAPNNETYVLGVLRFLGVIDSEGKKIPEAARAFVEHDDETFTKKFEPLVRTAYAGLFESFGETAWDLDRDKLIGFFRVEDESSAAVGLRQATTFQVLAGLAGRAVPLREARTRILSKGRETSGSRPHLQSTQSRAAQPQPSVSSDHADEASDRDRTRAAVPTVTVNLQINLPIDTHQETYDRIFKSMRENLIGLGTALDPAVSAGIRTQSAERIDGRKETILR